MSATAGLYLSTSDAHAIVNSREGSVCGSDLDTDGDFDESHRGSRRESSHSRSESIVEHLAFTKRGSLSAGFGEAILLSRAKKKVRDLQKLEEQHKIKETALKERRADLEERLAASKAAMSSNSSLEVKEKLLLDMQRVSEELEEVESDELSFQQKEREFQAARAGLQLTNEEQRIWRGNTARQSALKIKHEKEKDTSVTTSKKPQGSVKMLSEAEVRSRKKYIDGQLKIISLEEKKLKDQRQQLLSDIPELRKKVEAAHGMEQMMLLSSLEDLTIKVEDVERTLSMKASDWKTQRDQLKLSSEEERVLRGILARRKEAEKKTEDSSSKALVTLRRTMTKGRLKSSEEKHRLLEKIQDLESCIEEVDRDLLAIKTGDMDIFSRIEDGQTIESFEEKLKQSKVDYEVELEELRGTYKGIIDKEDEENRAKHVKTLNLNLVSKLSTPETRDKIHELFNMYCVDGGMDKSGFHRMLAESGLSVDEEISSALFERLDTDGSGSLEITELEVVANDLRIEERNYAVEQITANLRNMLTQQRGKDQLKKLFTKYDTDGKGSLDIEEFTAALQDLGVAKGYDVIDMQAVFAKFDADGSGSMEFSEFIVLVNASSVDNHKRDGEILQEALKKQKQLQQLQTSKQDALTELKGRKSDLEKQIESTRSKAEDQSVSAMLRMPMYEKLSQMQEEYGNVQSELAVFEETWKDKEKKLQLREHELRLIRGWEASQKLVNKRKEAEQKDRRLADSMMGASQKLPTEALVRGKLAALERCEVEHSVKGAAYKVARALVQADADESRTKSYAGLQERMHGLQIAMVLNSALGLLDEENSRISKHYNESKESLQLTPQEKSIERGLHALNSKKKKEDPIQRKVKLMKSQREQFAGEMRDKIEELSGQPEDEAQQLQILVLNYCIKAVQAKDFEPFMTPEEQQEWAKATKRKFITLTQALEKFLVPSQSNNTPEASHEPSAPVSERGDTAVPFHGEAPSLHVTSPTSNKSKNAHFQRYKHVRGALEGMHKRTLPALTLREILDAPQDVRLGKSKSPTRLPAIKARAGQGPEGVAGVESPHKSAFEDSRLKFMAAFQLAPTPPANPHMEASVKSRRRLPTSFDLNLPEARLPRGPPPGVRAKAAPRRQRADELPEKSSVR